MAGRAAQQSQVMTEIDSDGPEGGLDAGSGIPEGLEAPLAPLPTPPLRVVGEASPPKPEPIEVIEVDDANNPIGASAPQPAPQPREQTLAESDQGPQTYLERQAAKQRTGRPTYGSKAEQRAAQRAARDRNIRENAELNARLAAQDAELARLRDHLQKTVDPRLIELGTASLQAQLSHVDNAFNQAQSRRNMAEGRLIEAMTGGDHQAMVSAMRERDEAFLAEARLRAQREQMQTAIDAQRNPASTHSQSDGREQSEVRQPQPQAPQTFAPRISPVAVRYMQDFAAEHEWYDPNGGDTDSRILSALDAQVASEGHDSATPDYWDRLTELGEEYLPHRFGGAQPAPAQRQAAPRRQAAQVAPERRGPPVAPAGERSAAPGKQTFYLSPDRKQAMIEAGIVDREGIVVNRTRFDNLVREYMRYDRANQPAR